MRAFDDVDELVNTGILAEQNVGVVDAVPGDENQHIKHIRRIEVRISTRRMRH